MVEGVGGRPAEDNARGGTVTTLPEGALPVRPPLDLAVRGAHAGQVLRGAAGGDLLVTTGGFTDTVLWNPGAEALPDVPAGDRAGFLCLEPALLTPTTLEPGAVWRGSVRFTAVPAGADPDGKDPNGVQPTAPSR